MPAPVVTPAEDRVEPGHGRGLQRRQVVAVAVEGDPNLLVPEDLADDLGVGPGRELQGREGVAQVVDLGLAEPPAAKPEQNRRLKREPPQLTVSPLREPSRLRTPRAGANSGCAGRAKSQVL